MPVGIKATIILLIASQLVKTVRQYKTAAAPIAPSWMAISKLFKNSVLAKPKRLPESIRWPVEEIGKNSVMPSTKPKMTACNKFISPVLSSGTGIRPPSPLFH